MSQDLSVRSDDTEAALAAGHTRVREIRNLTHRLLPKRATLENDRMLEAMIRNHARTIYGEDVYEKHAADIDEHNLWEPHAKPMMVWAAKRRSNKTSVMAAFAAAVLLVVPKANVGSFSANVNLVERVTSVLDDHPSLFPAAAMRVTRSSNVLSFDMSADDTRRMRYYSMHTVPRGVYSEIILIDEPWYVDYQKVFRELIHPMLMVRGTAISAIGTPSQTPHDSEMQKIFVNPCMCDANRSASEACAACTAKGETQECAHVSNALPEWQGQHKKEETTTASSAL